MRQKPPATEPQEDLFRARLQSLVDPRHALVCLAGAPVLPAGSQEGRRKAARLIHAGRRRPAERQIWRLHTWLGRLPATSAA